MLGVLIVSLTVNTMPPQAALCILGPRAAADIEVHYVANLQTLKCLLFGLIFDFTLIKS